MTTGNHTDVRPADTRPAVDRGVDFDTCLVFTVRGDWGHFRRIDGNVVKQTYRVIPRTTVAGLCAAMLGLPRDSYYELFSPGSSAVAIEPCSPLRTMNMPVNALSTSSSEIKSVGHWSWPITASLVRPTVKNRQQHNYEVLVDPAYRIYIWLEDDEAYTELYEALSTGKSVYTPSLGLSEYLATVQFDGEVDISHTSADEIDDAAVVSAVPCHPQNIAPSAGVRYSTETSPGFMEKVPRTMSSRRTTGYIDWTYTPSADILSVVGETPISSVGEFGDVIFV